MKNDIILIGGGGHCKVVIDAIRRAKEFDIYGILDPNISAGETILGVKVLGPDSILPQISAKGIKHAFITVGSVGDCSARKRLGLALTKAAFKLPVIVHPAALLAEGVKLGEGTFVAAGSVINPDVEI